MTIGINHIIFLPCEAQLVHI